MTTQPQILGDSVVQQNPGIPFTAAQLAQRLALIRDQAGEPSEFAGRPGVGRFPVASQRNIAIPISHRLNPSDISTDNFTLQGLLGVIAGGLGAGYLGGGAEAGIGEGSASTAATGVSPAATQGFVGGEVGGGASGITTGAVSSGGGGMFDDFTGGFTDGGGDYVPGPEDGYTSGGGDYVPGPEDGAGNPSGLPNTTNTGLPNLPPGSSTVIGRLLGGGQTTPPTRPGTNTSGNSGAVNGAVSGVAGALIGNNLTGGGGFASRNDAASGNFDTEASLANQLWQTYQQQYGGPNGITTQAINDARNIDSPENQARVMGAAHADSAQATNAASLAAIERLRQYGVNPSSDRLASLNAQIQASGAASDAGSQTMARQHLVDTGIAARQNMAQLGNSLPSAAMTGLYSAGTGNAKLGSTTFDQADKIGTGVGKMIQPIAGGISDWLGSNGGVSGVASKVGGGISDWLGNGNASTTNPDGSPKMMPLPATYSSGSDSNGGYKRGGLVRGAGTGTSDSVPAVGANREPIRLSNGEYIIPADVVRHKGVEFFDRIVGKIHEPVGVRRA